LGWQVGRRRKRDFISNFIGKFFAFLPKPKHTLVQLTRGIKLTMAHQLIELEILESNRESSSANSHLSLLSWRCQR
jgi:hypothetical protein